MNIQFTPFMALLIFFIIFHIWNMVNSLFYNFQGKCTLLFYIFYQLILNLPFIMLFIAFENYIMIVLSIVLYFQYIAFKIKSNEIKYYNKYNIWSFWYFWNALTKPTKDEEGSKIIGHITPFNKSQNWKNNIPIQISNEILCGGSIITGASGSGKSWFLKSLIFQDIKAGKPIALFDFKGEEGLIEDIKKYASSYNVKVYEMSPYNINFNYDPLKNLPISTRVEALLNTRKWSLEGNDAHYRTSTQLVIQQLVNEFEKQFDYESGENYIEKFSKYVRSVAVKNEFKDAHSTLTKMLDLVLSSSISSAFKEKHENSFQFNLQEQYIVIFSFTTKELASSVSSFTFRDLLEQGIKGSFKTNGISVYVDESGTLENQIIYKDILEKGRSSKIQTYLAMQDLNQIIIGTNKYYMKSLLGTVNNFFIFNGSTKDMAEEISELQTNKEVESVIMNLQKPSKNKKPTGMFISKYSSMTRGSTFDTYKFRPYIDPLMLKINSGLNTHKNTQNVQDVQDHQKYIPEDREYLGQNEESHENDQLEEYNDISIDSIDDMFE